MSRKAQILLVATTAFAGCTPDFGVERTSLLIEYEDSVKLEESVDVVNVFPILEAGPEELLVADGSEAQFRIYRYDGQLVTHFGRLGSGPAEFRQPSGLVRMDDRTLFALDQSGRAAVFSPDGTQLLRTLRLPLTNVTSVQRLSAGELLLGGFHIDYGPNADMLHVLDVGSDSIIRSFFAPMVGVRANVAAPSVGWVHAAVRTDTVVVVFSPLDTIYMFSSRGDLIKKIPLVDSGLRAVNNPPADALGDPASRRKWLETFDLISSIYWMPDGRYVIPFQSFEHNVIVRNLLVADATGQVELSLRNTSRVLASLPDGRLLLQNPNSDLPNDLVIARYR